MCQADCRVVLSSGCHVSALDHAAALCYAFGMEWYHVIKTINGRRYVYRQVTWRADGRVKTRSEYLGPEEQLHVPRRGKTTSRLSPRLEEKSRETSRDPKRPRKTS